MKKLLAILMAALMLASLLCMSAFAAKEPTVTSKNIAFIDNNGGNNDNDGQTAATAKKQFLTFVQSGVISILQGGGTLVASGKAYIGGDYEMPDLGGTLLITSNYGGVDYKNAEPENNPACDLKMAKGATLTLCQDTIIDDIILFHEHPVQNTIVVTNNSTLVIGSKVVTMTNPSRESDLYFGLQAEKGSTIILNGGTFQFAIGPGEIINNGATIIEGGSKPTATEAPVVTEAPKVTEAPAATEAPASAAVTETGEAAETTGSSSDVPETTEALLIAPAPETTESADIASAPETTEAFVIAPAPAEESGSNATLWIVIAVVAAIAIAAALAIILKKKKK